MQHTEGDFTNAQQQRIYYQHWLPDSAPRALMLLVHGAGEHSGRYGYFVEHFTRAGYAIAALDHPGHGRSEGRRGYISRFDDYLDTLAQFQQQVSTEFAGLPQILVGHSMGGLISSLYLLQHQARFAGCILSGPALMSDLQPGALQMGIVRGLSKLLPKAGVLKLDPNAISRDPAEVRRYINDPLVYKGKASARFVVEIFAAMERIQQQASAIKLPLMLVHGGADSLASPKSSQFLHQQTGADLHIYPELFHEVFNEPEREQVFADVQRWCEGLLND